MDNIILVTITKGLPSLLSEPVHVEVYIEYISQFNNSPTSLLLQIPDTAIQDVVSLPFAEVLSKVTKVRIVEYYTPKPERKKK
jgi:hypothetical protein